MVAMVAIDNRTRPTPSPPPPRALNGTKAHGGEVHQRPGESSARLGVRIRAVFSHGHHGHLGHP